MTEAKCIEYGDCLEQKAGWIDYYCLVAAGSKIRVRKAEGGEAIGHCGFWQKARASLWICLNPLNGYRWEMDDDSLHEFYAEEGKGRRPLNLRLQHRKGNGGHKRSSASASVVGDSWMTDDGLFAGLDRK